jgi:transcriptional regulator with XRE-family HTH domain
MPDRPALAEFLRARREQLRPADVGLPSTGRRRTPGLRREELATLAGVSIDYLIRLEQGRDTNPSTAVLTALATALRLSDDERVHLFKLAAITGHPELCPYSVGLVNEVAPNVRELLDRLHPTPAFVAGPASHVLAWNPAWEAVVGPLGMLDEHAPNLAQYVFFDPRSREAYLDWDVAATEQVSQLRAARVRIGPSPGLEAMLERLQKVPEFASRWSAHGVAEKRRGEKRLVHPEVGELRLAFEVLLLPHDGEQRLITWLAADVETARALSALTTGGSSRGAGRGRLRVVGEA